MAYEKVVDNVRREVEKLGLSYLVVLDNDYANWPAYDNRYCPALYFIAAQTRIRRSHFGEANMSATKSPFASRSLRPDTPHDRKTGSAVASGNAK